MGNSAFLTHNNIYLDTGMKLEIAKMKHFKDKDLIRLYLHGFYEETQAYYLAELNLNLRTQEIEFSHVVKDETKLVNIIPCNGDFFANVIYSRSDSLVFRDSETKREFSIREENKYYSHLFWSHLELNELVGIGNNALEVIDIEYDARLYTNNSVSSITNFDKLIKDACLLGKSPYTNCICLSMHDSTMMIYDFKNKLVVDRIKTNTIVTNLSFSEINLKNMSCSEMNSNISHVYDFRRLDKPLITFRCLNESEDKFNTVIKRQSWIPCQSNKYNIIVMFYFFSKKCLLTLNSNSNNPLCHNVDYSMGKAQAGYIRREKNTQITNDEIIRDYYFTEKYLLLQYEKEIEIMSWNYALKLD